MSNTHSNRGRWGRWGKGSALPLMLLLLLPAAGTVRAQSLSQSSATAIITSSPSSFKGWYVAEGSTELISCDSTLIYSVDKGIGRCCTATGLCAIPTACLDSIMFLDGGSSYTCASPLSCHSMTIFEASPSVGPVATNFLCAGNWAASTIYRTITSEIAATTLPKTPDAATLSFGSSDFAIAPAPHIIPPVVILPHPARSPSSTNNIWLVIPILSFITSLFVLGLAA